MLTHNQCFEQNIKNIIFFPTEILNFQSLRGFLFFTCKSFRKGFESLQVYVYCVFFHIRIHAN